MTANRSRLKREFRRIGLALRDRLMVLPERLAQIRHDAHKDQRLSLTPGTQAPGGKVAILVLWQPQGLAESSFMTCRHLADCGYCTLIVSNAALSAADRARISAHCRMVIERPNRGHDFGAWRDAILWLMRQGEMPDERLLLLNDSIWFPLSPGDDLLARLEAGGAAFTGAAWMERPGRAHRAHFQSYLLMFGAKALGHPAFARFWKGYLVSSRRDSVLRRGEKGLSRAMAAAGLAGPPTISPAGLLDYARSADDAELGHILDYAALTDPQRIAERDRLLSAKADADFRSSALTVISASLMSGYFIETHPYLTARAYGSHFLKKRREKTSAEGRRQFLRAVADGAIPAPDPGILSEIRARDRGRSPA